MNALNMIPILGWLIAGIVCFLVAIPLSLLWNFFVPIYFSFLPAIWMHLPFWHVVGLLWLLTSIRGVLMPNVTSSSNS